MEDDMMGKLIGELVGEYEGAKRSPFFGENSDRGIPEMVGGGDTRWRRRASMAAAL